MNKKPYIIGICGGSASGKTFFLEQLRSRLPEDRLTFISQDNYYKKKEEQTRDEEGLINFDHPDSVKLNELEQDLERLLKGETLQREEYTFNNPNWKPKLLTYTPTDIIILEGLFIFWQENLAKLIDLKVFVDADENVRLSRRIRRDLHERGYPVEEVLRDYSKFVAPMYRKFVEPTKRRADIIVQNNHHIYKAIDVLMNHLKAVLDR
ncbi:MAG: uridine kinase [Bacteroidota bacterium]